MAYNSNLDSVICRANTINVINRGSKSIRVGFFKNIDPYQPSFQPERTINLPLGTLQVAQLGHVHKLTGAPSDPATWAEIHFDTSFMGMTFFDVSLIRGFNGAMVFSSQDGSLKTDFTTNLYSGAPNQFKTRDTGGYYVLQPTQPYTGGTNYDLVQYYREKVSTGNAYILSDDHSIHIGIYWKRFLLGLI